MIVFLDYDGVLHPSRSFMGQHGPQLGGKGLLFMWADLLVDVLAGYPHVRIVLSTSWVRHMPFAQVRDLLPVQLRRRVIGSTWDHIQHDPNFSRNLPFSYWEDASRYQQVRRWVNVHRLRHWLAIDDDVEGWVEADRIRLVQTNGETGLSDPAVIARLLDVLNSKSAKNLSVD